MLKDHLKTKSLSLSTGKTTLSMERYYWVLLEYLANEWGERDWRDWFYRYVLPDYKMDVPLAAHTRLTIATALAQDLEQYKNKYDPMRKELNKIDALF
jgi:hypothetical protein